MPKKTFNYKVVQKDDKTSYNSVTKSEFASFNSSLLGLGDISRDGTYVQALAAFVDLEGFTAFCNQVDAHLVIPEFLKSYLDWLFRQLRSEFVESETTDRILIWGSLPFFCKFLGDGVLFLWDTKYSYGPASLANIVFNLDVICKRYRAEFLPQVSRIVSKPPPVLRCGIARGQIISVGNGDDFVGSCINVASRLQKLSRLTFALSKRGFDFTNAKAKLFQNLVLKKVALPGIGEEELVYVKRDEFESLPPREKKLFKDP